MGRAAASLLDAVCEAAGGGASAGEAHGGANREGEAGPDDAALVRVPGYGVPRGMRRRPR